MWGKNGIDQWFPKCAVQIRGYISVMATFKCTYFLIKVIKGEPHNRPKRTHRVSGGIVQLFLNLGTRSGCVVSITPRQPLPPGKTRYPLYKRLGRHRSRCGKSRPTGIRSPDLPAHSESLYRLRYPGSPIEVIMFS
jgi:hypothetical protein